eukprot:10298675-Alexandrium_andersonii.AAC.1
MSASLVGSEMCIRDRPCCFAAQVCTRANLRDGPTTFICAATSLSPGTTCLLYTSDAADDM